MFQTRHTLMYSRAYSFGPMIFRLISLHKVSSAGGSHISDVIRLLPISTSRFRFLLFTELHSPSSYHRNGSFRYRDGRSLQSSTPRNSYRRSLAQQRVKEHSCHNEGLKRLCSTQEALHIPITSPTAYCCVHPPSGPMTSVL